MATNEAPKRNSRHTLIRALISYRLARGEFPRAEALKPLWRAVLRAQP